MKKKILLLAIPGIIITGGTGTGAVLAQRHSDANHSAIINLKQSNIPGEAKVEEVPETVTVEQTEVPVTPSDTATPDKPVTKQSATPQSQTTDTTQDTPAPNPTQPGVVETSPGVYTITRTPSSN